jgi:putative membrane protein
MKSISKPVASEISKRQSIKVILLNNARSIVFLGGIVLYQSLTAPQVNEVGLVAVLALLGLRLFFSILGWYFMTYQVTEYGIHYKYGILNKTERSITRQTIQLIEISSGPLQQVLGLVSLKIETQGGAGKSAELLFNAFPQREAKKIQDHLQSLQHHNSANDSLNSETSAPTLEFNGGPVYLMRMSAKNLLLYGASTGEWIIFLFFLIVSQRKVLPSAWAESIELRLFNILSQSSDASVLVAFVILGFVSWGIATVWSTVKFYDFKIACENNNLHITYGLFNKKSNCIPRHFVRSVALHQNIVQGLLQVVSIRVEVNVGRKKAKTESILLVPAIKQSFATEALQNLLPDFPQVTTELMRIPRVSLPRYVGISTIKYLIFGSVVSYFGVVGSSRFPIMLVLATACGALGIIKGYLAWKYSGFAIDSDSVFVKTSGFKKRSTTTPRNHIRSVCVSSGFLQRHYSLSTLRITVTTGKGSMCVKHIHYTDAKNVYKWFTPHQKKVVEETSVVYSESPLHY